MKSKELELVDVKFENEGKKAVLVFLDDEEKLIHEVNFNKQDYKDGKFVDSDEKAEMVDKWCDEYFGLSFNDLGKAKGTTKTVYMYKKFNSLFETVEIAKFEPDMVGQIIGADILEVVDDGVAIRIRFKPTEDVVEEFGLDENEVYESKMSYADYMEERGEWFVNPQKQRKQVNKFADKFGVSVDDAVEGALNGQRIVVEVKEAFGKFVYNEIKPLKKKGKGKK